MKKTLIALAVLAASGASFAQVTLTGSYGMSYQQNNAGLRGFATTDGGVTFAASEDLGGGLKASASLGMDLQGRAQGTPASTDAKLSLAGGFGTVLLGTIEAGNGILGNGAAGAPVSLANGADDGVILAGASNVDIIKYTAPAMSGLTFSVSHTDKAGAGDQNASSSNGVGVSYAAGALSASLDFTKYSDSATADSRVRTSAKYDLGVAAIGAGYQRSTAPSGTDTNTAVVGLSAPMGALTVGAIYAKNISSGKAMTGLGVDYALSKRTVVNGSYGTYNDAAALGNQYRVRVMHSF